MFQKGGDEKDHLTASPLEVVDLAAARTRLSATVLADEAGTWQLTGVQGSRQVRARRPSRRRRADPAGRALVAPAREGRSRDDAASAGVLDRRRQDVLRHGVYTKTVDLTADDLAGRRLRLDLGQVRDLAVVTVNGQRLPTALWSPYVVDVTDALTAGKNTIEVRVINTLANERNKILPSGLLGPVALRPLEVLTVDLEEKR